MQSCPNLLQCGFFKKYKEAKVLTCNVFVTLYCNGAKQTECKRYVYRQKHGVAPPDDMMPNGLPIPT